MIQENLKIFKNFLPKKSTLLFKIIIRIISNLSNSSHGQIILKGILSSALKPGAKFFLTGSKNARMAIYFRYGTQRVHFSLPVSPPLHRMGNTPTTLCCRCKEREESHSHYIFHYKLSQNTLNFINEIINHSYDFQSPFKIGIKDILMGTSCHTHDGVKLEILLTLIEVFLRHLSFCQRKTFYEDGYNKINELSNSKGNLISRFNTLRDMAIELDLKESFLKKWNLLINLNGTLNVKFG